MRDALSCAEAEAAAILDQLAAASTYGEVDRLMRAYVKTRFFLEDEDLALETFNALGQMSIARTTGIDPIEVLTADLSVRCDGSSSSLTKKILLIIALNRALHLDISPEEAVSITTLSALIERAARVLLAANAGTGTAAPAVVTGAGTAEESE